MIDLGGLIYGGLCLDGGVWWLWRDLDIIFEFSYFIMFPFKQIKSSLSHQNLPQTLPPAYPNLISSQSQLQIRRERINAVGQYDLHPKSTQNLQDYAQPNNGQPLTFTVNPGYKNKIKKATRPPSRGGNKIFQGMPSQRGEVEEYRHEKRGYSRDKLQDYSRTTSTILPGFNLQNIEQYQNAKTQNTPEKPYLLARNRQDNQPNWTPNPFDKPRQQNIQMQAISKTSPKINFVHPIPNQNYVQNIDRRGVMPHESYLLQDIKIQQQTIENFQREVIRLNTEIRELKNTNQHLMRQYDQIAKEMRIKSERSLEESQAEWHKEQFDKLSVQIEKMEKELVGKNNMITYLEQQCNFYNENYKKGALEVKLLKEEHQKEIQQLTAAVDKLKREADEGQTEANSKQIQNLLKQKDLLIQNLKRLIQIQVQKLQKQQHNILIDRSEINILLMKLQNFQAKNQQLSVELQLNSKKYQEDIIKQRQIKIQELTKYEILLHQKSTEMMNIEQQCRAIKQYERKIKETHEELEREKRCVENHLENLKQEFQSKNRQQVSEHKKILEANQALILKYKAEIESLNAKYRDKDQVFRQKQGQIKEISQKCEKLAEEKVLLINKLEGYEQKQQNNHHKECIQNIDNLMSQLKLAKLQKQQLIKKLEQNSAEIVDLKNRQKHITQQYEQMQARNQSLAEESTRLTQRLRKYQYIQQQNSRLMENMAKYQTLQLQNSEMAQKLQKYKLIQSQNIRLSSKQTAINELQKVNKELQNQLKQINIKLQNNICELSITKNELAMLKSANKYNLQRVEQLQRKDEKTNELIIQLAEEKEITLALMKQKDRLNLQISKDKQKFAQQFKKLEETSQHQLQKYMNLIEQNELIYESSLLIHKKSTQLLKLEIHELNVNLQNMKNSQLQTKDSQVIKIDLNKDETRSINRSLKHIVLSPNKMMSNQSDTSFVDYVQVDREGLLYICELLGIEFVEGGIINRIVEELQIVLGKWQLSKKYSEFYIELLELFGIQQKVSSNELLLSEIKSLKDSLSFLIGRISQEEIKLGEANKNIEFFVKESKLNKAKIDELKHHHQQLVLLNQQLNQSLMTAFAKLFNQKMQTRMVLHIIEDGTKSQNQISIFGSEPFFTIKSFKELAEQNNSETLK